MNMKRLILASGSPRRKWLLALTKLEFEVVDSHYEEILEQKLSPFKLTERLSLEKARKVANEHANSIIIGADTIVVHKAKKMGKPKDKSEAKTMLRKLSGSRHSVITGFTVIDTNSGKTITKSIETKVYFKTLSENQK